MTSPDTAYFLASFFFLGRDLPVVPRQIFPFLLLLSPRPMLDSPLILMFQFDFNRLDQ
jgi:hypothetical protein